MIILSIRKCQVTAISSVHNSIRMGENIVASLHAQLVLAKSSPVSQGNSWAYFPVHTPLYAKKMPWRKPWRCGSVHALSLKFTRTRWLEPKLKSEALYGQRNLDYTQSSFLTVTGKSEFTRNTWCYLLMPALPCPHKSADCLLSPSLRLSIPQWTRHTTIHSWCCGGAHCSLLYAITLGMCSCHENLQTYQRFWLAYIMATCSGNQMQTCSCSTVTLTSCVAQGTWALALPVQSPLQRAFHWLYMPYPWNVTHKYGWCHNWNPFCDGLLPVQHENHVLIKLWLDWSLGSRVPKPADSSRDYFLD